MDKVIVLLFKIVEQIIMLYLKVIFALAAGIGQLLGSLLASLIGQFSVRHAASDRTPLVERRYVPRYDTPRKAQRAAPVTRRNRTKRRNTRI